MKENNTRDPLSLKMTSMNELLTPSVLSAIQKLADKIPDKCSRGVTIRILNQPTHANNHPCGTRNHSCSRTTTRQPSNNQPSRPSHEENTNMEEIERIGSMLSDSKYSRTDITNELLCFLIRRGNETDVLYFVSKMFFYLGDYESSAELFEHILVISSGFGDEYKDDRVLRTMIKTCIVGCLVSRIRQGVPPKEVISGLFNSKFINTQDLVDCLKETETSLCTGVSQEDLLIFVQQQQQQQLVCNHVITN